MIDIVQRRLFCDRNSYAVISSQTDIFSVEWKLNYEANKLIKCYAEYL